MIIHNMVTAKISVIPLARMIAGSLSMIPYNSQRQIPIVNTEYIPRDRSLVCRVLMIFMACGKNETVVQIPAANPSSVTISICFISFVT